MSKLLEQINKEKKSKRLGDLVAINQSSIVNGFPYDEIEYIDTASVTRNHFDKPQILNINEAPSRAKRLLKNGDTILSTVRPSLCHYGFIKNPKPNTVASTGFVVLTPKNINPFYLYSYLTQDSITDTLSSIAEATTTTFPAFRPEILSEMEIELPDLPTQKKIAEILSAYDAKIENNNNIINNLEATAQTIFNEWFVNFEFPSSGGVPAGRGGFYSIGGVAESRGGAIPRATQNYHSLPYNPKLKDRAKELRKAGNMAEVLLWLQFKNKQFFGLDFDRQKIIGNYIVDFYCANIGLVVEIDGSSHNDKYEYDKERDDYLKSLGLLVLHFTDADVRGNMESILREIKSVLEKPPHPAGTPSQEGKPPRLSATPPQEGKPPRLSATPPQEGNKYKSSGGKMIESEMGKIPEGWEVTKISDFCDAYGGGTPSTKNTEFWKGGDISWVTPTDMTSLSSIFINRTKNKITKYGLQSSSTRMLPENTILMTSRATVGVLAISKIPITTNQGFISCVCRRMEDTAFMFWWLKTNVQMIKHLATGSTFPEISRGVFREIKILVPSDKIRLNFHKLITPLHDLIYNLYVENFQLKESRDQLLAKLI